MFRNCKSKFTTCQRLRCLIADFPLPFWNVLDVYTGRYPVEAAINLQTSIRWHQIWLYQRQVVTRLEVAAEIDKSSLVSCSNDEYLMAWSRQIEGYQWLVCNLSVYCYTKAAPPAHLVYFVASLWRAARCLNIEGLHWEFVSSNTHNTGICRTWTSFPLVN
jgi:hypothetical protein